MDGLEQFRDIDIEDRRQNLLQRADWFKPRTTANSDGRSVQKENQRIGKRRWLNKNDLARTAVRYVSPGKQKINGAKSIYHPLRSSQVSIRYGSQIHNTQTTALTRKPVLVQATPMKSIVSESRHQLSKSRSPFQFLGDVSTPEYKPVGHAPIRRSEIQRWIKASTIKNKSSIYTGERYMIGNSSPSPTFQTSPPPPHGEEIENTPQQQGVDDTRGMKPPCTKDLEEINHELGSDKVACPTDNVSDWPAHQSESSSISRDPSLRDVLKQQPERPGYPSNGLDSCVLEKLDELDDKYIKNQVDGPAHISEADRDRSPIIESLLKSEMIPNRTKCWKGEEISIGQEHQAKYAPGSEGEDFIDRNLDVQLHHGIMNHDKVDVEMSKNESGSDQSLLEEQNEVWFNMIMGLDKVNNYSQLLESNIGRKPLLPSSSPFKLDQMRSPTPNWTPESMKSTCVQIGSLSPYKQFDRSYKGPTSETQNLIEKVHQCVSMVAMHGSITGNQEDSTPGNDTPIKRSLHSPRLPMTPVKIPIVKPLDAEEVGKVILKPINLVPKFRLASTVRLGEESIESTNEPKKTDIHCARNITEESKFQTSDFSVPGKGPPVVIYTNNARQPPVTFCRPQRFEELNPGSKIRIGQHTSKKHNKFMRHQGRSRLTDASRSEDQDVDSVENDLALAVVDEDDIEE